MNSISLDTESLGLALKYHDGSGGLEALIQQAKIESETLINRMKQLQYFLDFFDDRGRANVLRLVGRLAGCSREDLAEITDILRQNYVGGVEILCSKGGNCAEEFHRWMHDDMLWVRAQDFMAACVRTNSETIETLISTFRTSRAVANENREV